MIRADFVVAPAVDVLEGRCVRLRHGDRGRVIVEGGPPGPAAARFAAEGAELLHVVDLDGAFSGSPTPGVVEQIATAAPGVEIQAGGGYRDAAAIQGALDAGAARVIVGTAALEPGALEALAEAFGDAIVVAIDVRDGRAVADGWVRDSDVAAVELAKRCADAGVGRLLVTATQRDGTLAGPDFELVGEVVAAGVPVIAAGGVASLDDVRRLRELGCAGCVLGSALWLGRLTLREAMAA